MQDFEMVEEVIPRRGGNGGQGAAGLSGSSGGGGAGGVSYGAYCVDGFLTISDSTFDAGDAAPGGTTADGMPSGQPGISLDEHQCR
jgi:hypothetical protein